MSARIRELEMIWPSRRSGSTTSNSTPLSPAELCQQFHVAQPLSAEEEVRAFDQPAGAEMVADHAIEKLPRPERRNAASVG